MVRRTSINKRFWVPESARPEPRSYSKQFKNNFYLTHKLYEPEYEWFSKEMSSDMFFYIFYIIIPEITMLGLINSKNFMRLPYIEQEFVLHSFCKYVSKFKDKFSIASKEFHFFNNFITIKAHKQFRGVYIKYCQFSLLSNSSTETIKEVSNLLFNKGSNSVTKF